ncbi:uncharacterized protein LOC117924795 [Vitis riparia]|uniref:uncharacterized protein LOC117924795 n=1 Tax=Vitis riparia TaxID=96939 RepID=UPI00155A6255|nr:uncharacterized protein LOC117924795 [Vitis riparia]
MASHVKKERGLLCVNSSGEGEKKSEERLSVKKQVGWSWGLRKSKTCRENAQYGGERVVEGGRGGGGGGGGVVVEARKSVSCIETNVSSVAAFLQVKVLVTDMPGFMQVHAFRCARRTFDSLEKFSSKHMAYNIKKVLIFTTF